MSQKPARRWDLVETVTIGFRDLYERGGEAALQEISRRKPILKEPYRPVNRRSGGQLRHRQTRVWTAPVSNELRKVGVFVSGGGVRSIWLRHDLETFQKRLKALSAKIAQDGIILTEDQLFAPNVLAKRNKRMVKSKPNIQAIWVPKTPITSARLKAWGGFINKPIDTYCKLAIVKLYQQNTPLLRLICLMTV